MEPLEGAALLEEVWHLGWAVRAYSLTSLPICALCFLCVVKTKISQLPDLTCHHAFSAIMDYPPKTISENKLFLM